MYPRAAAGSIRAALCAIAMVGACGDNRHASVDGGDASAVDATIDGPALDARELDAAETDAAEADAGELDAGELDAAELDALAADALEVDAVAIDAPELPLPVRLRVVASNLTSGNFQAYEPPGIRILDGLDPDVALIQEFNVGTNTPAELRAFVDQAFGPSFGYTRESGVQIANGVVSRYPIVASGSWDDPQVGNRDFAWARIDVPGPRDLWAVSVHLLTTSASNRNAEATALVAYVQAHVPAADLLVIGGDFNTDNRTEACVATLAALVDTAAPHPVDQLGDGDTNAGRSKPYDWVLTDADLRPYQVAVAIGASTYPDGLVFDSRVYTPLAEVAPALVTDSAAPSMQHMAVVKDFTITE
ncbi:MAG: endonuclease [Myxococcales bacterium]|nr:endonuclease [Myxococcales bacterium]